MKVVALKEAKAGLSQYCARSQDERVLITKHGRPLALVVGVEGREIEDVLTASNPEFWRMIEQRRRQPTISLDELRARLANSSGPVTSAAVKPKRPATRRPGRPAKPVAKKAKRSAA